jgi:hypothetical protein
MTGIAYRVTIESHDVFKEALYELLTPQFLAKVLRDAIVWESRAGAERSSLNIVVSREGCVSLAGQLQPHLPSKRVRGIGSDFFLDFEGGCGVCRLDYRLAIEAESASAESLATLTPERLVRMLRDGIANEGSTAGSCIGFRVSVSYDEVCRVNTRSVETFSPLPARLL